MANRSKLVLSALVAAIVLSAAGTAQARRFELSNQLFRAVWGAGHRLTFASTAEGSSFIVVCEVTLEGSFHSRTLSKTCGQLVGYVTRAAFALPCEGGTFSIPPTTLPWHIRYDSFVGTLPNITRIRLQLVNAAFLLRITFGVNVGCLYQSTTASPAFMFVELETGGVSALAPDNFPTISIRTRLENGGFCPEALVYGGASAVTVLNSTTRITIRLVQ